MQKQQQPKAESRGRQPAARGVEAGGGCGVWHGAPEGAAPQRSGKQGQGRSRGQGLQRERAREAMAGATERVAEEVRRLRARLTGARACVRDRCSPSGRGGKPE